MTPGTAAALPGYPVDVTFTPEAGIGRYWGIPVIGYFVRALAIIPHYFVLFFVWLVVFLSLLVTWIPVLLTGRFPAWGYMLVGGALRWNIRVVTWFWLMSGTYPPFTGADTLSDQHVRVRIDEDRPIGRIWGIPILGYLARCILLIPHFIVLAVLALVVGIVLVFAWVPVLVYGRQADLVYSVVGGFLRWQTRVGAWLLLLSGPYPPFRMDH